MRGRVSRWNDSPSYLSGLEHPVSVTHECVLRKRRSAVSASGHVLLLLLLLSGDVGCEAVTAVLHRGHGVSFGLN